MRDQLHLRQEREADHLLKTTKGMMFHGLVFMMPLLKRGHSIFKRFRSLDRGEKAADVDCDLRDGLGHHCHFHQEIEKNGIPHLRS